MKLLLTVPALMLLAGCSVLDVTEQKTLTVDKLGTGDGPNSETLKIASGPAQLRNVYVWTQHDGSQVVCPEPFPDVAASTSFKATADALNNLTNTIDRSLTHGDTTNTANVNATTDQTLKLALETTSTMVNLGGRNDLTILLANQLSYNCYLAANDLLGTKDAPSPAQVNMTAILNNITEMVKADRAKADAEKEKAEAAKVVAEAAKAEEEKKAIEAKKALLETQNKMNSAIFETMKPLFDADLAACTNAASRDADKIKSCNDQYQLQLDAYKTN